ARLYAVEERARVLLLSAEQRLALRQRVSVRLLGKLHQYLLGLQAQVLPKSPSGAAVRYALNQWKALTRFLQDGELEIDNGATERANRDIALGRGNWTFFGSDSGGRTAAVLRSFIASCKRCGVEPFTWFQDVLSRVPAHSHAFAAAAPVYHETLTIVQSDSPFRHPPREPLICETLAAAARLQQVY